MPATATVVSSFAKKCTRQPNVPPIRQKCSTHFWNPASYSALGGTAMIIRLIVLIGIRNLAIITSRCKPFNKFSASIPKKESTILTLRCKPIITSVTSYSFAVWIMPEAIFKSYRVICRQRYVGGSRNHSCLFQIPLTAKFQSLRKYYCH